MNYYATRYGARGDADFIALYHTAEQAERNEGDYWAAFAEGYWHRAGGPILAPSEIAEVELLVRCPWRWRRGEKS